MTIYFDMDGTIADLYSVDNWLDKLRDENATPYIEAGTLLNMARLARLLNQLQNNGYTIGIISWLSKESTKEYDEAVRKAKQKWLNKHLKSVVWDEIHFIKYGSPKHFNCKDNKGILFDDNETVRRLWNKRGTAYCETDILEVLTSLI